MRNELDLAWIAGLFEGEGSIHVSKGTHSNSLFMSLAMTDEQCVRLVHEAMGEGCVVFRRKKTPARDAWLWTVSARRAALCLERLLPYFRSDRVREKALVGLEYQKGRRMGTPARDPEHKASQAALENRLRVLNRRGRQD